jgi:hypothetical protein
VVRAGCYSLRCCVKHQSCGLWCSSLHASVGFTLPLLCSGWHKAQGINLTCSLPVLLLLCLQQSKDYDSAGDYIRHWLPELKNVPTARIHEPW